MLGRALVPLGRVALRPGLVRTVHSNSEFKPGPFPVTEEQRLAAAKRYNLHPDKYEPYPDDGIGYGDYPKLPMISTEARSDFYPWDDPTFKRNYDETIHAEEQNINDTRVNVNQRFLIPLSQQFYSFIIVVGGFSLLFYILEDFKTFPPIAAKQYPTNGAHYTFETKNSASSSSHH